MNLREIKENVLLNTGMSNEILDDNEFKAVAIVNIHGDFNRLGMSFLRRMKTLEVECSPFPVSLTELGASKIDDIPCGIYEEINNGCRITDVIDDEIDIYYFEESQMNISEIDLDYDFTTINGIVADIYIKGSLYYINQWYHDNDKVNIRAYYDAYQTSLIDAKYK